MAKTLYIIGNGFDIYHGLDTRYQFFAFYLQKNNSELYDLLVQYYGLPDLDPHDPDSKYDPLWSQFEKALAGLDVETVLDDNTNYLPDYGSDDFRDRDYHAFQIEMELIIDKLTKELFNAFKDFILSVQFPDSIDSKYLAFKENAIFLNFNYTDTLEKYYGINRGKIIYIHGKAKEIGTELVLGHGVDPSTFKDDPPSPPKGLSEEELFEWQQAQSDRHDFAYESGKEELYSYFYKSFKPTAEIIIEKAPFFASLRDVTDIYVLGHSIASVDQAYFHAVIQATADEIRPWYVSYHKDDEKDAKKVTLKQLGLAEDQINLIRIEDLKVSQPTLF
jgi:hypothetical protein